MSLRVITIVWDRFPQGGSKLLAMLALADWASDDGTRVYPSAATLARKIRMSERQAKRLLEGLVADDFLELQTEGNRGGRRQSNRYRVKLETLTNCPVVTAETRTNCPESEPETRTPDAENPDIAMSENPDIAMSGEPLDPLGTVNGSPDTEKSRQRGAHWDSPKESRVDVLRKWIAYLQKMPPDRIPPATGFKNELERARLELLEIAPETAQENLL